MINKAKTRRIVKIGEGVIGIDIGKYKHSAVAQSWDSSRLKPLVFENTLKGFEQLLNYQSEAKKFLGLTNIRMALEPTGHYWKALAEWVNQQGINLEMIQPAHTHKAKELEDNSPGKTDDKDAGVIADLAIQGKGLKLIKTEGIYAELRYLTKFRQELVKDLTREINRLHRVMDVLFPELLCLSNGHISQGLMKLLREVSVPDKMLALGATGISKLLKQGSRKCLGLKRAQMIVEATRHSIGVQHGRTSLEMETQQLLERIEVNQKQLKEIEKQLASNLEKIPYIDVLLSIPQIGEITIATILGEAGDLRQYHNVRQIIKLAGLNLYEVSSGQYRGRKRIAKRGRPLLRQILYLAGLRLIKQKGFFYQFYRKLVEKGKAKPQAIVAVGCKLLRVLFAMVRDHRKFEEKIEDRPEYFRDEEKLLLVGA